MTDPSSRKLIRPTLGRARTLGARGARRPTPPEETHAEASYLLNAAESRATLVVKMLDGTELRGRVDFYDRDCIKLQREGRPGLIVRKSQVKYYWMERAPGPPSNGGGAS